MAEAARIALLLGLILGPLAGLMAFAITYEEYQHHFPNRRRVMWASLEAGVTAFLVFLLASVLGGILAAKLIR